MMHASVLNNIETLGKATQRLAERPAGLAEELQEQLRNLKLEYEASQAEMAAASPAKVARDSEQQQLEEVQRALEQMSSELRRSEMHRDAARAELEVVQSRNVELRRELAAERAELRKLRQERRLLTLPGAGEPRREPRQTEHPELATGSGALRGAPGELSRAEPRPRPMTGQARTRPGTSSTPRGDAAPRPATAAAQAAGVGHPSSATYRAARAPSLSSRLEPPPATASAGTQTAGAWNEPRGEWERHVLTLQRTNARLQTALLASTLYPDPAPPRQSASLRHDLSPRQPQESSSRRPGRFKPRLASYEHASATRRSPRDHLTAEATAPATPRCSQDR